MKLSFFLSCSLVSLAKGLFDHQLQKRGISTFFGSLLPDSMVVMRTTSDLVVNQVKVGTKLANKHFLSNIEHLLLSKEYDKALYLLNKHDITDKVYTTLLKLAVKKGDTQFLVSVINSKPRSVLADLKLMRYVRQTSEPERANYLSSIIANNIGETVGTGNFGESTYYNLNVGFGEYQQPSGKAFELAKRLFSEASNQAEKKVWSDIISDIKTYSQRRRASPPPSYFEKLKYLLRLDETKGAKLYLKEIDKYPIHDYFKVLTDIILKGDKDLISYVFSKGTIRRSAIADAEFMKLAREIHPGSRGEELSRLIGKEIPFAKRMEVFEYAYKQSQLEKTFFKRKLWEGTFEDILALSS